MPRLSRINIPDQTYHVINRGNNKDDIFFEDEDYEIYLSLLAEYASFCRCRIHAYVLMTNHVHLLITPDARNSISSLMQNIGRSYVRYINKKYNRTGTLWEGRFKSSLIDAEEYLFICMRYIELNPVRARMVRKPEKYPWSSHHHNAFGETSKFIVKHRIYKDLGNSEARCRKAYTALFQHAISQDDLDLLRQTINGGWVVGDDKFKKRIGSRARRPASPRQRGGDRRSDKFRLKRAK